MEFKGTPGPWSHSDNHGLNETVGGAIHGGGNTLCLVMGKGIGKERATANAKLMSAAPDLLNALINLIEYWKLDETAEAHAAMIAINKALGRE